MRREKHRDGRDAVEDGACENLSRTMCVVVVRASVASLPYSPGQQSRELRRIRFASHSEETILAVVDLVLIFVHGSEQIQCMFDPIINPFLIGVIWCIHLSMASGES